MYHPSNPAICAPSVSLPPLSKLLALSSDQICHYLDNLRQLYGRQPLTLPPKLSLPIRRHRQLIHDESVPDSGYASAEEEDGCDLDEEAVFVADSEDESFQVLRADPLERAFAIKWVTAFIARSDMWASLDDIDEAEGDRRTEAVENATRLLSVLLSSDERLEEEEDCSVTRSFRFLVQGGTFVEAELNDAPLVNEDHTCVGLQSWASSIVLSEQMCADPSRFLLSRSADDSGGTGTTPSRVLELGAGTGLLSIVAAKILSPFPTTSIFATDYHPDVLVNLRANIASNFPGGTVPPISVHQLNWEFPDYSSPMNEPFDLILGADVVYHPDHARWIKACVGRLLLRPSSSSSKGGVFWLMIALRISGRHEGIFHTVEDIFPDASASSSLSSSSKKEVNEWELAVLEKIELGKLKGVGRADERGYLLFKIGWIAR